MSEEPEKQETQNQGQDTQGHSSRSDVTNVAITLWLFMLVVVAVIYPTYLGANSSSVWVAIATGVFYVGAASMLLFGLVGVFVILQDDPKLRQFVKELLPLGLPGSDAWQNAGIMATLFIFTAILHLFFITLIGLAGIFAILMKTLVLVLLILAALFAAVTLDEFFFQPFRSQLSNRQENVEQYKQRIRKILVGVAGSVGTIVAIIGLLVR